MAKKLDKRRSSVARVRRRRRSPRGRRTRPGRAGLAADRRPCLRTQPRSCLRDKPSTLRQRRHRASLLSAHPTGDTPVAPAAAGGCVDLSLRERDVRLAERDGYVGCARPRGRRPLPRRSAAAASCRGGLRPRSAAGGIHVARSAAGAQARCRTRRERRAYD